MTKNQRLNIVQMNDSHAYFDLHQEIFWEADQPRYRPAGGYARIATIVKQVREQNAEGTLFCDCGDTLHGTYPAIAKQGESIIPVLNSMGINAMTAHWEFAYGPKKFQELASRLNYPVLAANIYEKDTKKRVFKPYVVQEIGGISIGLIGIASNIVDKTMPPSFSEGIRFTLGREELPELISALREREKVKLIVLISHLGFPQDMKLLSEVYGVDLCLSGHTHNRLYKPVSQGKTLVIQSGSQGSFLGLLDLDVEDGKIVNFIHRFMEVKAGIQPDPTTAGLVGEALSPFSAYLSEMVGESAIDLYRGLVLESTMDNFILQALMEKTGSQLAFSNGWRYGAPVTAGNITLNDLCNMAPMNPPVSLVELAGEEIRSMLEENMERTFSSDPYRQMGGYLKRCLGLKCYFKVENPAGQRIQKLFIGREEVQPEKYYLCSFITAQGVPQKYGRNRRKLPEKFIDVLRAYLHKHKPVHAELRDTFTAI